MLSKKYRIHENEFTEIYKRKKRIVGSGFHLMINYPSIDILNPKFAFVVSKKISKSAYKRNTIKRKFRVAVYNSLQKDKFRNARYVFQINDGVMFNLKPETIEMLIGSLL
jgi:ribonuclease P protein component